ncbi:regulator of nucleoside diphosphate kinase [Paraburkholderia sp. Clong3]|uniref:GreA/GreB family elongation factor n=1 Tax=unclassified Paraburkholderia TaxID=2615204 RepID=UPI0017AE6E61|nr:GreA/GreB family elongation factor [Paraburkholderia sp. CI2]MBB5471179.1 regulator of nucleoside diphosphate kinase [Paraburkholderia sp. CI2]
MLSAKNISITAITGRMEGQPVVSESDMERLRECAHLPRVSPTQRALLDAMEATALFVDSAEIPPDVVTMNTTVECTTTDGTDTHEWTLVYPREADYQRGRLSVLSPTGIALLGARCGQVIMCLPPSGVPVHYVIRKILLQPESRRLSG